MPLEDSLSRLIRISLPYTYDVVEGNIPNHFSFNKFGYNPAVGSTLETVWGDSSLYTYLSSASILKISSTDTKDAVSGVGALTVQIYGLDSNYDEINETVILTGQTPKNTVKSYLRVFRMIVLSAGSELDNAGTIYAGTGNVVTGTPANKYALISPGDNQTLMALWTVPSNHTAFMTSLYVSSAIVNKSTLICLFIKPFGEVFQVKQVYNIEAGAIGREFTLPLKIEEKSDIEVRSSASGGGGSVSAAFDVWYEIK